MMTKLREMTFIFIWILVFAFVGLMVFEWGMDFTGLRSQTNIVGKINGNKVTIQDFQQAVQNFYLQEREQSGTDPDEERLAQIRDQVWEQYIQRVLFGEEIQKRNIQVSDQEIFMQISQNPQGLPPAISQNPNFMTDDKFDMTKYQQALSNPQIDWTPIEGYLREILPFQKLQNLITASVMVTEEEIKDDFLGQNQKAKIQYLHIPVSTFFRDSVIVSDQEIKDYYNDNKSEFELKERRRINYVSFASDPSPADSQKIIKLAQEIKEEASTGGDFAQLADEFSEDPSVRNNHGDLGYFERGRMVKEFSDAAFAAKEGEIVGPVKTNFGIHIIKVHDKKTEDGEEKVNASHILFKFSPSALTIETAQNLSSNFAEEAKEEGFRITADKFKYEIKQTPEFTQTNYIPGFGQMTSAVQWIFNSDLNEVSRVHRTSQGYAIFEISEILPAGFKPFDEVRELCRNRLEQQKRKVLARAYAENIKLQLDASKSFTEITTADTSRKVMMDSTNQFSQTQPVPKIGRAAEITAAAFTLEEGVISPMLESNRGYYFIVVTERTAFNEEAFLAQKQNIRTRLLNQKSQKFFTEWYEQLKENADIEDNRSLFFAS
jgi:parvulin-like peptidyl-prolyl isomerase